MATLAQVRTKVDNWLTTFWPNVVTRQATYLANHGQYWQGLWTHSVQPTDNADTAPDLLASHPTDQLESWLGTLDDLLPANMPAALKIDVYDGPEEMGFVGTVAVKFNSKIYMRSRNEGPEIYRTEAWHEYVPTVI